QMSTEMSTEIQHGSFQQITPLTLSFTVHPNKSVTLYHAIKDQRAVILRVLKGTNMSSLFLIFFSAKATANTKEHQAFLGFAHFLSDLGPHPCLPLLLGPVTVGPPLIMVMEELVNRDLLGFLWRYRQSDGQLYSLFLSQYHIMAVLQFYNILIWKQEFLHSKNCTHGNVRARSVLVGQDLSVKLWGFGPAFHRRMEAGSSAEIEVMEMRKWQAPEVLAHRPVSHSSDIWSFGILLYEMVTFGEPPFPKIMACELLQHLQRGKSLQRPANCSISLYSNMKACCQWRPQDRPTLTDLISKLKQGGRRANDRVMLRVPEPIDMEKYMREAGYGERYNYAFL
uniref:Protein kinase domain-containing protein n=1 Tax=Electrophorus electricus TaxID=8005 RepID=A0A4W4EZR6_ELEEL